MDLEQVIDKVFEEKLFQHLDWNDLLCLRRVCKWTKKITDVYLKANPERAPELEINEKYKPVGSFLKMGIPTTKLFINNPTLGHRLYEDYKVHQFLEVYGPLIKDLRVTQITLANGAMCRDKELAFMEGLSNLESLEVDYCGSGWSGVAKSKKSAKKQKHYKVEDMGITLKIPETFKKLEKVKIGRDAKDTDLGMMERKKRTRDFLMQCTRLKSICFPTCWLDQVPEGSSDTTGTFPGDMCFLVLSFEKRPNQLGFEEKAEEELEMVDFQNCHEGYGEWLKENWPSALPYNWYGSQGFLTVCQISKEKGIKLANVSPYWFYAKDSSILDNVNIINVGLVHSIVSLVRNLFLLAQSTVKSVANQVRVYIFGGTPQKSSLGEPILSLVGLDPVIMDVDMPNLEKITIPSTCFCVTGGRKRPEWPSLKIFDITVDGNKGFCWNFVGVTTIKRINGDHTQDTDNVFAFLFCNIVRPSVTEFHLKFKETGKLNSNSAVPMPINMEKFVKEGDELQWGIEDMFTVPCTGMIVKCCHNLKVLKLGNWQGTNQALLLFWNGLGETLEEVELENCRNVADFTFFGNYKENPEFLKLKNLKKLSLKGLDKMSKVTDLVFMRILSQMKLTKLVLTSNRRLEKVTKDGIRSLLQGPFAESIENFPFKGWSLPNVTPKEFEEMGKKFRSYNML